MKELLWEYAEYNVWANKLIVDALLPMGDGIAEQETASSFPTLRTTVAHTYGAEHIWLQRLQLVEHPAWVGNDAGESFAALCRQWQQASAALMQFIGRQHDDKAMEHVCEYKDRSGNFFKTPVYQILHHVFNHSTYHRGQLITMMRQLGVTTVPGTDFIAFVRRKG